MSQYFQQARLPANDAARRPKAQHEEPVWAQSPGRRTQSMLMPSSDCLGDHYSALADDTTQSPAKREAAMVYSVAEKHLSDEGLDTEDLEAGLKTAKEAAEKFEKAGDKDGAVDAKRLEVFGYRLRAEASDWENEGEAAMQFRKEAMQTAKEALAKYQESGNKRGQGAMLLSLAELVLEHRGTQTSAAATDEAMNNINAALDALPSADALKGHAYLALAHAQLKKYAFSEALKAAEDAEAILSKGSNGKGFARALHVLAVVSVLKHDLDEGIDYARDALKEYRNQGSQKNIALELLTIAYIHLEKERPNEALPLAQEALDLCERISAGKGLEAAIEQVITEAYVLKDDVDIAVESATKSVARVQEIGDRREEVIAQMSLACAENASGNPKAATQAATAALDLCKDYLRERNWEASVLLTLTQTYFDQQDFEKAQDSVNEAVAIFQEDLDTHHEAVASTILSGIFMAKGDSASGLSAAERGRDLFKEEDEKDQEAVALLQISQANRSLGNNEEAMQAARDSADLCRETGNKQGEANALSIVADCYTAKNEYAEAVNVGQDMQRLCQRAGLRTAEAYALLQIAGIYLRNSQSKQAARVSEVACKIAAREHDRRAQVHMLLMCAQAHLERIFGEQGRAGISREESAKVAGDASSKALKCVKDAVAVAKRLGSNIRPGLLAAAQYWYAQVMLLLTGRLHDSLEAAEQACDLTAQVDDPSSQAYAVLLTAKLHLALDNTSKAEATVGDALALFRQVKDAEGEALAQQFLDVDLGARMRTQVPMNFDPSMMIAAQAAGGGGEAAAAGGGAMSIEVAKPKGLNPEDVQQTVVAMAREAVGVDEGLYLDSPLMDSGMDSLTAVSFRNGLQQSLNVKLPSSLMFDYPTMKEVANRIVELSQEE